MPAVTKVPTIEDFREAARRGIRGWRDPNLSVRSGGGYDFTQGPAAVIWSREAQRDRDLFLQVYTESATDADRDRLVEAYYHVERVPAAYGLGTCEFTRPSAAAGAGRIYAGTRVAVLKAGYPPAVYAVLADTDVTAAALSLPVPMRATRYGTGVAANVGSASGLRLDDILFDATLRPAALVVGDGTDREEDDAYLARARADLKADRVGHIARLVKTCREAGAWNVVCLHSGTFGDAQDFGLNHIYVSDANYVTTLQLQQDCFLALDAVRVAGCDVQVLGMDSATISVALTVAMNDSPGAFDLTALAADIRAAVVDEFAGRSDTWTWRTEGIRGAASKASPDIQSVGVVTNPAEPAAAFTATLTRYRLFANDISVTFTGPT